MNRLRLSLVCVLALGVSACDNGPGTADGGPRDSGPSDGGGPVQLPVLRAAMCTRTGDPPVLTCTEVEPDLSCLAADANRAPTAGDPMDFPVRTILRGQMDMNRPSTTVRIFRGNRILATCTAPDCIEITTDDTASGSVNLPAGAWFAYQVSGDAAAGTATTAQVNAPAELASSGVIELSVISQTLFSLALEGAMTEAQAGTSFFTGTARDCAGLPLVGAQVRVFGAAGEIPGGTGRRDTRYVYWADPPALFPSSSQRFTSQQGRYAGANIPPENTLRIELYGRLTEDAEPTLLACEEFGGQADQITILNVNPLRADAPAACSR